MKHAMSEEIIKTNDSYGREILTVSQLRQLLEGRPDDEHVVIAMEDWYRNIECVALPDLSYCGNYIALTFHPGSVFDARQV